MPTQNMILEEYRAQMARDWRDGELSIGEIDRLKVFAALYHLNADEHEAVAQDLGIPPAELTDVNNINVTQWLRDRRESAALTTIEPVLWQRKVSSPPASWQNALAVVMLVALVAAILVALLA